MNRQQRDPAGQELYAIADLAREFGISTRAIRYYEARGLLLPERVGSMRVFRRSDRARLILILRGKRLGFSLAEIAEYLSLYDAEGASKAQDSLLLKKVEGRLAQLERQLADLTATIAELKDIRGLARSRLAEAGKGQAGSGIVVS